MKEGGPLTRSPEMREMRMGAGKKVDLFFWLSRVGLVFAPISSQAFEVRPSPPLSRKKTMPRQERCAER